METLGIEALAQAIAQLTLQLNILSWSVFGLSWAIASLLQGMPIPLKEIRSASISMRYDVLKAAFMVSIWNGVSALIAYVASLLLSAL